MRGLSFNTWAVAGLAAAIVLAVASAILVASLRQRASKLASNPVETQEEMAKSSSEQRDASPKKSEQPPVANASNKPAASRSEELALKQLASNYAKIDLRSHPLYRGAGDDNGAANRPIQLSCSRNRYLFRLPDGASRGLYNVTIKSPSLDETLKSSAGRSFGGKTLKVDLDLRNVKAARYVLCIEGRAVFCYEIVLTP